MQMSSLSTNAVLKVSPTILFKFPSFSSSIKPPQHFIGSCLSSDRLQNTSSTQCNASSTPLTSEGASKTFTENIKSGFKARNWNDSLKEKIGGIETGKDDPVVPISRLIKEHIESIKSMLGSMDDGEITISAYDTAWVALVEDMNGNDGPQFPSSLEWISSNQLPDGSWGDKYIFSAHDRLLSTLACVIALKFWNVHPHKSEKGMEFVRQNLGKLEGGKAEHMPIGFEVAFPSLLEIARKLEIVGVPEDSPVLQEIYARRSLKLTRIPKEIMHSMPTTLLHSLEGMPGLDWEKLLKLQCNDGSFLFSPSSTAFALMQTKDHNCLTYLTKAVQKFGGGGM
ncbi:hypothetical protein LIER_31046 [Lithospermum erythrorhizon]|uniref:Uncharacterized protein n=1 Tax=Lithospermum erythrorhizon TaxID=34254 RepID=A0AAV3RSY1_LITER